jgi:hypothetical protein
MKVKDEARKIVENLSDDATWDDLMYKLYVRTKIERSIKAAEEGNVTSHEEVRKRFLGT